ncbi:hypothetical protein TD95_000191 [Thielaviopsis punctulata]|uniref:YTH domain-containing protein n=1 Tax=Thielaviopsis punctulata TaxID=72032 RepID=A0A0F4ZDQ0_9PEZI|nr:hypothetical protein TD95_000191 [Thielaviopsis punctulata]
MGASPPLVAIDYTNIESRVKTSDCCVWKQHKWNNSKCHTSSGTSAQAPTNRLGYAVWIGNLPVKTDLMDLVRHVHAATTNLESLFLISKSNCAFANFRDEASWRAALEAVHDSEFHTMRLVARHRRLSPETGLEGEKDEAESVGDSSADTTTEKASHKTAEVTDSKRKTKSKSAPPVGEPKKVAGPPPASARDAGRDRYFVLKSLTVEDLQQSTRTGVWATQAHNEAILNEAYSNAANVYLIFSANKSGEYFGYARMTSALNPDPAVAIDFAPLSVPTDAVDALTEKVPASGCVPAGRIVHDELRGTIFWEVDGSMSSEGAETATRTDTAPTNADTAPANTHKTPTDPPNKIKDNEKPMGKPFTLRWLSTTRVGFQRTRGLANAWNGNREVKIARDGTEIEPEAGARLVQLFHSESP